MDRNCYKKPNGVLIIYKALNSLKVGASTILTILRIFILLYKIIEKSEAEGPLRGISLTSFVGR